MSKEELFQQDLEYRMYRLKHFAKKYFWAIMYDDGRNFEFESMDGASLKINYVELNIQTSLSHPRWGRTVLLREGEFNQKIIESIFRNPRAHMKRDKVKSEYVNK